MAADPGKEVLLQAKEERKCGSQATRKFKAEAHTGNHPNDPAAELFDSGGSSSSGTWMASDACEAFSNGSNDSGSNGSSECVDCDPGSLRLRSLLQAAARERSASLTSSCCDGESESEEKESEEREQEEEVGGGGWGEEGPPRFVARAASARKFMERRARDSSGDSAAAAVLASGAGGGGDNAAAAAAAPGKGADADVEGAAALAAALEAVLLCPPQVLARNTSCQGQGSFLSSLLTPTSEPSDRADDHPCTRGRAASGDGNEDGTGNSEGDDEAAEDAIKAALAWSFPVPKLPRVEEESGVAVDEGETTIAQGEGKDRRTVSENWDIVTSSAPGSRSNAMPESVAAAAAAAEGGRASNSALVVAGHREGFDVVDGDHGVCGRANGGEGGGYPPLAVSSGGGGGGGSGSGGKERRRASLTSNSSGELDADTLPPSPVVSGTPNARTASDVCEAAEASSAAASSSAGVSPTVTPTGTAGGGFPPRDTGHERTPKQGGVVYSKTAADDDDSGSVEDDGGGGGGGDNDSKVRQSSFGSAGSSGPPSDRRSNQRARWGSMNMSEFSTEDAPPSATAMATEREKLILSVFGRQAGAAELATVGRSNSCHVFLEAASRIAALPPLERSLLAELDRSSDDEGDGGISGTGDVVASRPRAKESAPSSEGAAAEKASPGSRELPMSRVGYAEAGPDAAGAGAAPTTTAYRYRRLAGNSGRGWPPRVDPARREEWLCPIEFEAVFGMTFAAFRDLPSWKQIRLKQEVHLF